MKQLHTQLLALAFLLTGSMLSAQSTQPFWSEDFSNNIPAGWTNADGSNQGVIWKWCADNASTCSPVFSGEDPFQATTAATGYVHVNSDAAGELGQSHVSRLTTSAINCTGKNAVFVKFQSHIGTYTVTPAQSAVLRVSTDLNNWTSFTAFPDLTALNEFSPNPEVSVVDITSVAASQTTVYLQWQWTGNYEYMWDIDDVELYDENPTAKFDLSISNYFYPASSFATPVSQIATDTFGFFILMSNRGLLDMKNVKVKATVEDLGTADVLFADSVILGTLPPGATDSVVELPGLFAPELIEGAYAIRYTVEADSVDQRPGDNEIETPFIVTGDVFSKENGAQTATRPASNVAWTVGNYYVMTDGQFDDYKAIRAEFAFATDSSDLLPSEVTSAISFLKVNDDVLDDFSNFETGEFPGNSVEFLGYASYEAPDGVENFQLQQVDLIDLNTSETGIPLVKGGRYFLSAGYADEVRQTNHAFSTEFNYFNVISTFTYSDQWYLGGFGDDLAAVLRLYISLSSTTDEKPLPENALRVFPNPVSEVLNLSFEFDTPTDATITIADLSGRVIRMEDRQGLTSDRISYTLPQLVPGIYLARVATGEGTRTVKFAVQR